MNEYDAGSGESAEIGRIVRRSVRQTLLVVAVVLGAFLYSKRTELGCWGMPVNASLRLGLRCSS